MLICTMMDVNLPHDLEGDAKAVLLAKEAEVAKQYQLDGKLVHLWRVTGRRSNISVWDVADNQELHDCLMGFPLYPYLDIKVIPMNRHPSSIA